MLSTNYANSVFSSGNFEDFSSKVDLTSNKTYLTNAYGHNVQYVEKIEIENQNKTKLYKLVATSAALVGLGGLFAAARTKKIDVNSLINEAKNSEYTEKIKNINIDKFATPVSDFCMNFANIKDDVWDRFTTCLSENTPLKFIKSAGDKLTKKYIDIFKIGIEKRINLSQEEIIKILDEYPEFKKYVELKDFDIVKIASQMRGIIKENRISKGIFKDGFLNGLKKMTSPIADGILSDVILENSNIINEKELEKLNAPEELIKQIKKYNTIQLAELFPKLRDICCGSAPNDIVCASFPVMGFAAALAATKDKEKRQSIMLNVGIPLIPTCLMPLAGLKFPILNGFRGMAAGFAVGQIIKQTAKVIDNKITSKNTNT